MPIYEPISNEPPRDVARSPDSRAGDPRIDASLVGRQGETEVTQVILPCSPKEALTATPHTQSP